MGRVSWGRPGSCFGEAIAEFAPEADVVLKTSPLNALKDILATGCISSIHTGVRHAEWQLPAECQIHRAPCGYGSFRGKRIYANLNGRFRYHLLQPNSVECNLNLISMAVGNSPYIDAMLFWTGYS